jgi:GntR family transcriptional regulator
VIFKITPVSGKPIYWQLVQQIRHAVEIGVLKYGDMLPGIRSLAAELVVSHNTIAKAYAEMEHAGLIELRHGSGAYIAAPRSPKLRSERIRMAQQRVKSVIGSLRREGFSEDEIRRLFDAEFLHTMPVREKA